MDDKKIEVGMKVKLRDGSAEGNVTEVSDNEVTVVTGDGATVVVPPDEVEEVKDEGGEAA